MEGMKIAAGIVMYNPDLTRLRQNIEAILPQVDALYVVDNASANWKEAAPLLQKATVIRNEQNLGIASALNQLMRMGQSDGMQWVLTLDQDSVSPSDLVGTLAAQTRSHQQAGILCPVIVDRSFGIEQAPSDTEEVSSVKECITSASLTSVEAWRDTGGFDQRLFIDAVDTDFCLSLHEHGWQILRVNAAHLLHEIGHQATRHHAGGRTYIAFNHSPIRYYYMARNMVFLSRKHPGFLQPAPWRCMLTMLARMLVILLWEKKQKLRKCYQIIRGCHDGVKMKLH